MRFFALFFTFVSVVCIGQATIYRTADDYGSENTVQYEKVLHEKKSLLLSNRDGSVTVINLKSEQVWGFRNSWGEDYRLVSPGKSMRILEYGKICVYVTEKGGQAPDSPELSPGYEDNPYRLNSLNSFSIGPTGKVIKFSNSRFMKALRTDPPTYEKFREIVDNTPDELLLKIIEHNTGD